MPLIEVTAPPSFAAVTAEGSGGARVRAAQAQGREAGMNPFLNRGRQGGGLRADQGWQQPRKDRSISAGKRQRNGEWQELRPNRNARAGRQQRAQAKVIKGTSNEFAELAGPVTFWVGKCRPELEEAKIEEIISKCAQSCEVEGFVVESVKCLTKDPNPWTRSFKVSVPARFEEAMKNP